MIRLSQTQLDALARNNFSERMALLLHEQFPEDLPDPGDPALQAFVQNQTEAAYRHGFAKEREVATYVLTAWMLGEAFDRAMPAVAECLADPTMTAGDKADWLEAYTVTLFEVLRTP